MAPFAEAGGIKDVVAGLSRALSKDHHNVTVVIPMYKSLQRFRKNTPLLEYELNFKHFIERIQVYKIEHNNLRVLFISASCFSSKEQVYTYSLNEELENSNFTYGSGHHDRDLMNILLQRSTLETAFRLGEAPHLFHLHDGHCGFLPAIMKSEKKYGDFFKKTGSLLTIHNAGIAYQQNIADTNIALDLTGLPLSLLKGIKLEYGYSPLICAGLFGHINTVSEQYAEDIVAGRDSSSGILGFAFKKKGIQLNGITNGIDIQQFRGSHFKHGLHSDSFSCDFLHKENCKRTLFKRLNDMRKEEYVFGNLINDFHIPLITIQSRITYQKGIDIFIDSMKILADKNIKANFLVIGEGEKVYESSLTQLASTLNNFCYIRKYDFELSQHLFAAGDFFLIPSRWEPCGLTDFIAQLFGNIPIVHETGGLVKTENLKNGFSYKMNKGETLSLKIIEVVDLYFTNPSVLHNIQKNAVNIINEKYTWEKVLAERYLPLYKKISKKNLQ